MGGGGRVGCGRRGSGWGEGGQGRYERRTEVFVKIQKKYFLGGGGSGGGSGGSGLGVGLGGQGVVNVEVKFL